MGRYTNKQAVKNEHPNYKSLLEQRGLKQIVQYRTPKIRFPSAEEIRTLSVESHIWTFGDRYYKLAHKHYSGRSELWWVIAMFNRKPTEAHCSTGDIIYIPKPLDKILAYMVV